jgi:hypothetical protein
MKVVGGVLMLRPLNLQGGSLTLMLSSVEELKSFLTQGLDSCVVTPLPMPLSLMVILARLLRHLRAM